MELLWNFFKSRVRKALVIAGALAALLQILALALPNFPVVIQWLAQISLISITAYLIIYFVYEAFVIFIANVLAELSDKISAVMLPQLTGEVRRSFSEPASSQLANVLAELSEKISTIMLPQVTEEVRRSFSESASSQLAAEQSFLFSSERYGIGYDTLEIECIIHKDGSAIVQRTVKVVAFSDVDSLDTYLLIPEARPPGETQGVDLLEIKCLTPGRTVSRGRIKKEYQRLSVELKIGPTILRNEQSVTFELREQLPAKLYAIGLTRKELNQREMPDADYFALNINRPTRRLSLRVYIPNDSQPANYGSEVRYASASGLPADRSQREEEKRITNPILENVHADQCVLKLDVDYPMIGLIYMVRWQPIVVGED